jgi:hypothetical protein
MPHLADDDYHRQFASYVRDSLRPDVKVYVEWSNEVWHTGFAGRKVSLCGLSVQVGGRALDGHVWGRWAAGPVSSELLGICSINGSQHCAVTACVRACVRAVRVRACVCGRGGGNPAAVVPRGPAAVWHRLCRCC